MNHTYTSSLRPNKFLLEERAFLRPQSLLAKIGIHDIRISIINKKKSIFATLCNYANLHKIVLIVSCQAAIISHWVLLNLLIMAKKFINVCLLKIKQLNYLYSFMSCFRTITYLLSFLLVVFFDLNANNLEIKTSTIHKILKQRKIRKTHRCTQTYQN